MSSLKPDDGRQVEGTMQDKNVTFVYNGGKEAGILDILCVGSKTTIDDYDVVAVVNDRKPRSDSNAGPPQHPLVLLYLSKGPGSKSDVILESVQVTNLPQSYLDKHLLLSCPRHLSIPRDSNGEPHIHIVVSVRSGTSEAQLFFDKVVQKALHAIGLEEQSYKVHITQSESSITDLARTVLLPRAHAGVSQTVLLLSGDGAIFDIVNVLFSSPLGISYVKPTIGLISMGTGNALANSTGLNQGLSKGVGEFLRGTSYNLPTFTVTFSPGSEFLVNEGRSTEPLPLSDVGPGVVYGTVICSWALHASLVADSDTTEYRKYGSERFQMAANELLAPSDGSSPHAYKGKVTLIKTDELGKESHYPLERHEHLYILATLVSNLEKTLTISPRSKPLDGQLRLVHFGAISAADVMKILGMAFQGGKHVEEEAVGYDDIDGMRIDFEEKEAHWRRICVDGKIVRVGEDGWVEVRRGNKDVLDIVADLRL